MEHSYRYRLRFGGPIWLPKLPSIFPRVFENFQATDRSISHARRYRFPKIATGNRKILVSLSMFYAGHRWYMCSHTVRLTLVAWSVPKCRRVRHWLIACGPLYCTAIKRATAGPRCRSSVHTLVTL